MWARNTTRHPEQVCILSCTARTVKYRVVRNNHPGERGRYHTNTLDEFYTHYTYLRG